MNINNIPLPFIEEPRREAPATAHPITHTLEPYVTGTSIIGIKFKGGVMIAADTLGSYGSLARFRDVRRLVAVGKYTVVGASGEISDFQFIQQKLEELTIKDYEIDDNAELYPREIHQYLTRMMYARRNKFDPLWNTLVVAGYRDGKAFLGYTDLVGTAFEDNTVATGYGAYLAQPLLRKHFETFQAKNQDMTKEDARKILEESMRVLYYRDARAYNSIQIATITEDGIEITEPFSLETQWAFKGF